MGANSPPWHSASIPKQAEHDKAYEIELTWAHMIDTTSAKFIADLVCGSKAKVGDSDPEAVIEAENILRLQVSVIDTERVAVLHCVDELQEDVLDKHVVSKIAAAMEDLREQIVVRSVVHDDVSVVALIYNTV